MKSVRVVLYQILESLVQQKTFSIIYFEIHTPLLPSLATFFKPPPHLRLLRIWEMKYFYPGLNSCVCFGEVCLVRQCWEREEEMERGSPKQSVLSFWRFGIVEFTIHNSTWMVHWSGYYLEIQMHKAMQSPSSLYNILL